MRMLYLHILSARLMNPNLSVDFISKLRYKYDLKPIDQPSKVSQNAYSADKQPSCSKKPNYESITNDNVAFSSKDCKDNACSKITSHVGQDRNFNSINDGLRLRPKPGEQSDSTHCFKDKESRQEGFVLIKQDQNDVSVDINNPKQIEQSTENSSNGKNAAFPGWNLGDLKGVSYLASSEEIAVPPNPSAPTLDDFDDIIFNNMHTYPYLRSENLHVNDMKESYNMHMHSPPHPSAPEIDFIDNINSYDMHMYSNLHQPSADNNDYNSTIFKNNHYNLYLSLPPTNVYANDNINHTYMLHNSHPHQYKGPSESLHGRRQFSNTHVKPRSCTLRYNENFNCNRKLVNIENVTCPYPINSAENTREFPQPITSNFNKQRNILDNGNSTANIKSDMFSNLMSPENFLSNSAPCDYAISTKEDQKSSKIPNVIQNSHTNTNYNKYGENILQPFLCPNQDIEKLNTCPYPTENNIYTDVLLSPTNNLSNPMAIHQINSKHEVFDNLNSPNYSSRITYENKLVTINQEDEKKDTILNAPKNFQKNLVESCVHSTVDGGDKTKQKTNTDATSNMQYNIREKSPFKSCTTNQQGKKNEETRSRYEAKKNKQKKKDFDEKKQNFMKVLTSFFQLQDDSPHQIPINDIVLSDDKTKFNSFKIVDGDKLKNAKIDEIRRDGRNHKNDDIELKCKAIGDELHGKTISYNEKPNNNSC